MLANAKGLNQRERDIEIAKSILLAAAAEGAIDNFTEADLLLVAAKAREEIMADVIGRKLVKATIEQLYEEWWRRNELLEGYDEEEAKRTVAFAKYLTEDEP